MACAAVWIHKASVTTRGRAVDYVGTTRITTVASWDERLKAGQFADYAMVVGLVMFAGAVVTIRWRPK